MICMFKHPYEKKCQPYAVDERTSVKNLQSLPIDLNCKNSDFTIPHFSLKVCTFVPFVNIIVCTSKLY